jgi:thimet oligopeptidase
MPAEIPVTASEDLHCWESGGAASAAALATWVGARLAAHEAALAALLSVEGPRTAENSLRLYDQAIEQLTLAGAQAGVLNSVASDKAVRDQAQEEAQRISMAGNALSLNRDVYEALEAINLDGASAATKHYVERTLLGYRLAGVDEDQATRGCRWSSAATFRKAARPLRPPRLSWMGCRRIIWRATRSTARARLR